jgi:hypothetical protein
MSNDSAATAVRLFTCNTSNTFRLRGKGERGKGKGLNLPFPLCPLTFSQTKREIVRLIRKVLATHLQNVLKGKDKTLSSQLNFVVKKNCRLSMRSLPCSSSSVTVLNLAEKPLSFCGC